MSLFERSVTEGNERMDELVKDGAMLHGGDMAQIRASTAPQRRQEVHAFLQIHSWLSLFGGGVARLLRAQAKTERKVDKCGQNGETARHRTEWCAATSKYRGTRCGMSSNDV